MVERFTSPELGKDGTDQVKWPEINVKTRIKAFETLSSNIDRFLENPPKQPKKTIVEYMGGGGNIFSSFDEAKSYLESCPNTVIIVRSEHPQEYAGASGLLKSYTFTKREFDNISSQQEFEEKLKARSREDVEYYCQLTKQDFNEFYSKISYSYWKKIHGVNRSIVADSAIQNRYHIFTNQSDPSAFPPYLIIENGKIINVNSNDHNQSEVEKLAIQFINFYEEKRNLQCFVRSHCPIIEFQTDIQGQLHPLQYHRTRNFSPAEFTLDRDLEEGEIEATFVRGATKPEGEVFNVLLNNQIGAKYYHEHIKDDRVNYGIERLLREPYGMVPSRQSPDQILVDISESSIRPLHLPNWGQDATIIDTECRNPIFEEIMSRKNKLSILLNDKESILCRIGNNHISKSAITNSRLTIGLPHVFIEKYRDDFTRGIKLRVVSDGKKAYVRVCET